MSGSDDARLMRRALELAQRGEGFVEPNPMVGCLLVRDAAVIAEGWHRRYGGPHAEAEALAAAGERARGATAYVTLEPCAHQGKTPPCADALIAAGVRRVVSAMEDPFPAVQGAGLQRLRQAGVEVQCPMEAAAAAELNAPYLMRVRQGRPWVIAKWAMTLDGKLASRSGDSRWISNPASRAVAHALRGRMDAVLIGIGTALADDPLLTARPAGPRQAARIVLDSHARLPLDSQLVRTCRDARLLLVAGPAAEQRRLDALRGAGCDVWQLDQPDHPSRLTELLRRLGAEPMTNILVEGGARLLGSLLDAELIDEAHAFVAPKLIGGSDAPSPLAGQGRDRMPGAARLRGVQIEHFDDDVYIRGRVRRDQQEGASRAPHQ